jgi:predicted enzyme related to lactoylglutathione lyase
MAKVEHFEIPVDDIARAQAFYTSVLGFGYEAWGDEMGMLRQPQDEGVNENSRWVYIKDSEGNIIGLYDEISVA